MEGNFETVLPVVCRFLRFVRTAPAIFGEAGIWYLGLFLRGTPGFTSTNFNGEGADRLFMSFNIFYILSWLAKEEQESEIKGGLKVRNEMQEWKKECRMLKSASDVSLQEELV